MNVQERLHYIQVMLHDLSCTSSRIDKEGIINYYRDKDEQLSKDITYVFELLSGMYKLGFTFMVLTNSKDDRHLEDISLREYLEPLFSIENKSVHSIYTVCSKYDHGMASILRPILNRDWKVGVNKSQLEKNELTPMLAKKYEPGKHCIDKEETYFITEKLDGNRCLAYYNDCTNNWVFVSRSGKVLRVQFDMIGMPKKYIYDGEILSRQQIENPSQANFNTLSGALNSKYGNKNELIYVIFDIVSDVDVYARRRSLLDNIQVSRVLEEKTSNTTILCLLSRLKADQMDKLDVLLENIESKGGEGLMINIGSAVYQHKRTDKLLKVKSTYTMDMKVIDIEYGTGKYEGVVGSLICEAYDNNITYECKVGSGLSDDMRYLWADHPSKIIGKIVEIAYFSLSQSKNIRGTNTYSLRFPRFKKIRDDKDTTSVD